MPPKKGAKTIREHNVYLLTTTSYEQNDHIGRLTVHTAYSSLAEANEYAEAKIDEHCTKLKLPTPETLPRIHYTSEGAFRMDVEWGSLGAKSKKSEVEPKKFKSKKAKAKSKKGEVEKDESDAEEDKGGITVEVVILPLMGGTISHSKGGPTPQNKSASKSQVTHRCALQRGIVLTDKPKAKAYPKKKVKREYFSEEEEEDQDEQPEFEDEDEDGGQGGEDEDG